MSVRPTLLLRRFGEYELALCLLLNGACRVRWLEPFFAAISRFGDGIFWYTLIAIIPVIYGPQNWRTSVHMVAVGLVGILTYKLIKSRTSRPRPYALHSSIKLGCAPLDHYSFPSGHTLHAVAFTLVATAYHPELVWVLVPFTILVMLSRIVLGLHYPTDVVAGVLIGASLAELSFALVRSI